MNGPNNYGEWPANTAEGTDPDASLDDSLDIATSRRHAWWTGYAFGLLTAAVLILVIRKLVAWGVL